jgi:hypothetical protein
VASAGSATPDDDPDAWVVDTTVAYVPTFSAPAWIVPSPALPPQVTPMASNNCCGLCFHDGRLYFGWRTSELHFASPDTKMYVISSADQGRTWSFELEIALGTDVREPSFVSIGGRLFFRFMSAGKNPLAFEPQHLFRCERLGPMQWTAPVTWGDPTEVAWDVKVRGGRAYQTSYLGNPLGGGPGKIDLRFSVSTDGISWSPVDPTRPAIYTGGDSECAFEFDETGSVWGVARDEHGDATGFGAHLATAPSAGSVWQFPASADPRRYDSPKMIRHGKDLYLIARRDVGGPYDLGLNFLPFDVRKDLYLALYSARPKRTSLYSIDRSARTIDWIFDFPSNGDTAFPAVWRTGAHTFLVANYTSPLGNPDWAWIQGQLSPLGSQVYFTTLTFNRK